MGTLSDEKCYISFIFITFREKVRKTQKPLRVAFGGIQGVPKEELSRDASQIYLRKRAGCTHVTFRENAKCTIETSERTRGDFTAHTLRLAIGKVREEVKWQRHRQRSRLSETIWPQTGRVSQIDKLHKNDA